MTLRPLHKYQPVLHVVKNCSSHGVELASFSFQETQFVAVTAYQNEKVGVIALEASYRHALLERCFRLPS